MVATLCIALLAAPMAALHAPVLPRSALTPVFAQHRAPVVMLAKSARREARRAKKTGGGQQQQSAAAPAPAAGAVPAVPVAPAPAAQAVPVVRAVPVTPVAPAAGAIPVVKAVAVTPVAPAAPTAPPVVVVAQPPVVSRVEDVPASQDIAAALENDRRRDIADVLPSFDDFRRRDEQAAAQAAASLELPATRGSYKTRPAAPPTAEDS
eukprot:4599035-Prymnesium_polylepis.1